MSTTFRTFILALVLGAVLAPSAQASPQQLSIMMDDDLLVYRDDTTAAKTLTQMQSLGVDAVRVTVLWENVAENARLTKDQIAGLADRLKPAARRQTRRFKPADPSTYPIRNWDRYDNLVKAAADRGIRVYFNVTGPGPAWAHESPPKALRRLRRTWKPKAGAFKLFVTAVGRRFDGTYRDENASRGVLPRVNMWSLWNEPNQAGWLTPQWERRDGRRSAASPSIYRKLHQFGYKGLVATGHRVDNDIILLGETAPLGSDAKTEKAPMRPGLFLRQLTKRGPLEANGYAHHPYTKNVSPIVRDPNPDSLTMANANDLATLLDTLATRGTIRSGLPLYMTEFGFETNPPDPFSGVPLANQAKFNTIGEYQAYSNPRIAAQSQFLLYDVPPRKQHAKTSKAYWFTYQSGLFYQSRAPQPAVAKPAAYAYSTPFLAFPAGVDPAGLALFNIWGQLRFLKNGTPAVAQIQWAPATDLRSSWQNVGDPVAVDERGYFTAQRSSPQNIAGGWRAVWLRPDGSIGQSSLPSLGTPDGT